MDEIKNEFNKNKNIVVIASGNPLFYGIGTALIRNFGAEYINIVPHIGSIDVALSKLKISINTVHAISVHGRPIKGLAQRIKHYKRVIILTDKINSPDKIAGYMIEYGLTNFRFIVLERLGYNDEKIRCFNIKDALNSKFSDPNLILLMRLKIFHQMI
ncbi:precorrin-6y C5,15-methyltransferase (decarboxylating) subunit CbiE [Acidiplasma cupricumulans]|uniref:precorrin-6y C5,15-methyltransferase (decarboxylating) subunit CbiE n=1 Tax=Acidiplasma cupricumulans TaxID=312540 RepID=UPI000783B7DE|nr:precorrin-6y C5,15-methyltransferase (decarboxylating) subunit CbiE [Acidiplasma cupricumulans]